MEVPSKRYTASERKFTEKISEWEYGSEYQLSKVKKTGYFTYKGQGFFLSEGFGGKTIAIRESHLPGQINLEFRQFKIGRISLDLHAYTMKKAQLIDDDPRANV